MISDLTAQDYLGMVIKIGGDGIYMSMATVHYSLVIRARVAAGGRIRTDNKLNGTGVFDKYGEVITGPRARQDLITLCQA